MVSISFRCRFNFKHHFPDITLWINGLKYGLELKSKQDGKYVIPGGSVLASSNDDVDYVKIYLFFGVLNTKKDDHYHIKYCEYFEAIKSVAVTHSPRFIIDLENTLDSIFKDSDDYKKYHESSKEDKVQFARKELQKIADGQWFAFSEQQAITPIPFSTLSPVRKQDLTAEALIIFIDDILKKRINYERISEYYLSTYFIMSSSLRDVFTAGGKVNIMGIHFPKIISTLHKNSDRIEEMLNNPSENLFLMCQKEWSTFRVSSKSDLKRAYYDYLDKLGDQYFKKDLLILGKNLSDLILK